MSGANKAKRAESGRRYYAAHKAERAEYQVRDNAAHKAAPTLPVCGDTGTAKPIAAPSLSTLRARARMAQRRKTE